MTGFPIVLLLAEGLRYICRKVNILPANPLGQRTLSPSLHARHSEHEE